MVRDQQLDILKATLLVTADFQQVPCVDTVLFFGRARGDDNDEIFKLVAFLYNEGATKSILINGSNGERVGGKIPGEAWAGKDEWTKRLIALDVDARDIHYCKPAFQTAEEGRNMLEYAKEKGWKYATVITQPHQAYRAMSGLIREMKKTKNFMDLYSMSPRCNWFEKTAGSQGATNIERIDDIYNEYSRIHKYIDDLEPAIGMIEWYRVRDKV